MTVRLLIAAKVVEASSPTAAVRTLVLAPVHRKHFPPHNGGDHVQLQLRDGTRRDYSLCGPPGIHSPYEVAIQRQEHGRGGSLRFHGLEVGQEVFVSYPQPGMNIDPGARRHVFVAGGIGITAILGLLYEMPPDHGGEIHYCVRERDEAIYLDRLATSGLPVHLHVTAEGQRLDVEALIDRQDLGTTIYHCGPPRLMEAIDAAATARSVPVRSEAFAMLPARGEKLGTPFDATMIAAGKTIRVGAEETLLQAMLRAGVPVEYSCEGGVCGACVIEVRDGAVDHRDRCLTDELRATGMMTACVSRARDEHIGILL